MDDKYIKRGFESSSRRIDDVSLVFHAHIDALESIPVGALKEMKQAGFQPYNFQTKDGEDATKSALTVNIGQGRDVEQSMFVLNYVSNYLEDAQRKGRQAKKIMEDYGISGYVEVEQVYELPMPNVEFDQDEFDRVFSVSADGNRQMPFMALKASLKPEFKKTSSGGVVLSGDFSVGEIHVTLPKTVNGQVATDPVLIDALLQMGFLGPDVPKRMYKDGGVIDLVDVPFTISASNGKSLAEMADAIMRTLKEVGWSSDARLTADIPIKMNFEIMKGHHWIGGVDPSTTYRDVLEKTLFHSQMLEEKVKGRGGRIGGYKLPPAEKFL
ncbi:MAG: hypothetical protein R3E13_07370 [Alphaproteobacteria bacterium]